MSKKISIVLVAMLCLSMLPWTSIDVSSETKNVKTAETLEVDAWVESKLAKPGDTIKIYANTSYTDGVSVSADIMEYEHSEDVIFSLSLENLDSSGMIYTTYIATVPLNYDYSKQCWIGEYTIPSSSAGAFYVADVTATDGVNTANDNATSHLYKFYDKWLKPVQDKAETFLYGEFNDTINDIKENMTALNDTINAHGGIKGIVENLTGLSEWQALLNESYDPIYEYGYKYYYSEYFSEEFSDSASFEYNITVPNWVDVLELSGCCSYDWEAEVNVTVTLTDLDGNGYTYDLNDRGTYMISSPTPGNCTINVATSGNGYFSLSIGGYPGEKSRIACFLDNLTKFILSDEYESIKSMIPELKSFILGIPEENIIDYFLGFNLTHYLEKIEGTEGIIEAYNAFMNSDEYADLLGSDEYVDFQNALDALQASETYWNMENLTIAIMYLLMSDEMMDLLNATAEYLEDMLNETADYLQGNDTVLQNLINSFVALDGNFNSQLETLVKLPEFKELINTVKNDPNLGPVFGSINTTFNNINNSVETMKNSTQLQNLDESIQNLQKYMENNVLYEYEYFSEDETFNYNYTVKDWMKELCLDLDPYFDDNSEVVNDIWTWIPGAGNITVTLTDPNGVVYTYTEAYNGSEKKYEDGKHDYTIQFPAEGNWTINVTVFSDSGDGYYDLNIGPKDELFGSFFVGHMVRESLEEIFFVFNAGIAIETDYFQTIGSTGSAKLIAYNANGRIPNEEISVVVSRNTGGTVGASGIIPAAILYTWVSGFTTTGTSSGVYAFSTGAWSGTGNSASASVISTTPTGGIKCSDITWQLIKTSDGTVVASGAIGDGTWSGTSQTGAALTGADYLKAGCAVTVSLPETGEYKVRAIVGGSQIYESATFTTSGSRYAKDKNPNEAPVAVAEVSSPMLADTSYSFDASGSYDPDGYIVEYEWDFGDGNYAYGEYVEHTYTKPGTYIVILTVTDNESAVSTTTIIVDVVEAPEEMEATTIFSLLTLSEAFPYIKQLIEEINPGIVYEAIVTTDSNGEATINFPVEEFGIYTIDAYFEDENRIGFGESAFIGESYIPEIGLTQIGKFAGIPVYMNPNKIGENITFNVNILENENASVGIGAIPLEELFPDINMSYESSDTTITGPDNVSLQVNGPISLIAVATGIPFGPEEKEEEYPPPYYAFSMGTPYTSGTNATFNVIYVSPPEGIPWNEITWQIENVSAGVVTVVSPTHIDMDGDGYFEAGDAVTVDTDVPGSYTLMAIVESSMIYKSPYFVTSSTKTATVNRNVNEQPTSIFPQFNISFGILLTSNVSVSLDVPSILKGERSQIDVSATSTPVITYGVAYYANGLDIMSLDVTTLSKMVYESAVYQKEYNLTDVMELMKSIICGPGNSAFVTIPKLAVDGDYSFITLTNVDNTDIGTVFTSVNVYAEAGKIPVVTSSGTVDNKDVAVTYVGSGKVTIKKATVTPPAPPANVKHIGVFVEVDTTGTVHDAFITIKYNDSDISGVDEAKLRMYYWNETISEWVLIEDSGVWTNNNTVWARVTHFTIFAPMAEKAAAVSAPIPWMIYVGVFSAVIIIIVISLAASVKRKKKILPPLTPNY